jgi:predicted TIM-barrel fold metal-dependent hydrolase
MMINRFANCVHNFEPGELEKLLPDGFDAVVRRQYYDIAGVSLNAGAMAATLHMVPPERLVYGSDVPFGSTVKIAERLAAFDLPPETIRAIRRGTAMSLFPRASALA